MPMIFRIRGVDGKTGADRTIHVEADDERHALALAKGQDIHPYEAKRDKGAERAAAEQALMLRGSREKTLIVPLDGAAIRAAVRNENFAEVLNEAWRKGVNL